MHPKLPGLIATAGHYTPVGATSDDHRPAQQGTVLQALHGYEKSIKIKVHDMSMVTDHFFLKKLDFLNRSIVSLISF
jgi:hypothetical protein